MILSLFLWTGHGIRQYVRWCSIAGIDRERPIWGPALSQHGWIKIRVPPGMFAATKESVIDDMFLNIYYIYI